MQAGQVIGFEGHKGLENGGYTPHLHLDIRDGRMFEEGMEFAPFEYKGKATKLEFVHLDEKELELACDNPELTTCTLGTPEQNYPITARDGKLSAPSAAVERRSLRRRLRGGLRTDDRRLARSHEFLARVSADVAPAPTAQFREPSPPNRRNESRHSPAASLRLSGIGWPLRIRPIDGPQS